MKPLPLPVRVAAGLVATALEQARDLPRTVVEFPVTAVSQALQVSMRVQQKVTALAIKGDRALGGLRPVEERPSWARFDDEEPPHTNGRSVTPLHPDRTGGDALDSAVDSAVRTAAAATRAAVPEPAAPPDTRPEQAERTADPAVATAAEYTRAAARNDAPAGPPARDPGDGRGPNVLPAYPQLSIPQLRAKLRTLNVEDLRLLLAWERANQDRPPFVTMLTNRITTVTEK